MDNLLKIKSVKNITVDDLSNNYKLIYITKFQNAFTEDLLNLTKIDPKTNKKVRKTKEELCKEIGISDTTLKRYMKDLGMKSFYRHENTYVEKRILKKKIIKMIKLLKIIKMIKLLKIIKINNKNIKKVNLIKRINKDE